ncbi:MAG: 1-acyl-sn-glycerol-3-phosphate acyltransferase [Defluviitaleaceae bacterium]|nr:1-acyl-sn-glycerol-3-phosphate acyltransferase [Defluviitaleaceae bacterium]
MLYRFGQSILSLLFNTIYDIKIIGDENLPKSGAVIVCANHISALDPVLLGVFLRRPICFMAKHELFDIKLFGFIITKLGAFPVNRDAVEITTLKKALEVLKSGQVMGIFSQGGRLDTVNEDEGKAGVALFAVKSGAPVVPVGIKGSFKPFSRLTVSIGKPMSFKEYEGQKLRTPELSKLTKEIMVEVKKLAEQKLL